LREDEKNAMKLVQPDPLELVKKAAPPEAEIVPLTWAFEDEDYNIAATASEYAKAESHYPSTLSVIPGSWRKMGSCGLTGYVIHAFYGNDTALKEYAPWPRFIKSRWCSLAS
jgi:hypothetical protein